MNLEILFYYFCRLIKTDCVGCGSLLPTEAGLCHKCHSQLNQYKKNDQLATGIISLYSWKPQVSDLISSYVYYLKSPFSLPAWAVISKELLKSGSLNYDHLETLIIPIPSSTGRNHSLYFAKTLSKITKRPYKQVLSYEKTDQSDQSQKHKNKLERAKQSFSVDENFTDILQSYQCIIFVDDIITTGATYTAAQRAIKQHLAGLGLPNGMKFILWTAFVREKVETRC